MANGTTKYSDSKISKYPKVKIKLRSKEPEEPKTTQQESAIQSANGRKRATNKSVKEEVRQFLLKSGKKPSEMKNSDMNEIQKKTGATATQLQNAYNYFAKHYPYGYSLSWGPNSNAGKVRAKYPNADSKLYSLAQQGVKVHDKLPKGYRRSSSQRLATLPPKGFYWAINGPNDTAIGTPILVKE